MEETIRIILADDHLLVRNGIKSLLEAESTLDVIGEASNGKEALELAKETNPDILIIDVRMPIMDGIEAVGYLSDYAPNTKAIVLSMHDSEEYILKSIKAGASGYLLKDTGREEFLKAINTIYKGGKYFSGDISNVIVSNYLQNTSNAAKVSNAPKNAHGLTKKEIEILSLILSGMTNTEISDNLGKSKRTIETHRFNLMKKMNVKNLIELSSKAKELGFS
ncbi:response regulator transcription factor [Flavicella sediminum]|uniref:response regulator transcription factor n=1 Tax=Flavicella sediminum TaxID=2585141 RepID=UPI001124154D|nr:response regulator transcription factor [Flavicella sediminum]